MSFTPEKLQELFDGLFKPELKLPGFEPRQKTIIASNRMAKAFSRSKVKAYWRKLKDMKRREKLHEYLELNRIDLIVRPQRFGKTPKAK